MKKSVPRNILKAYHFCITFVSLLYHFKSLVFLDHNNEEMNEKNPHP